MVGRLDRESDDVLAALNVAAARPEIDAGRLGVMGSSFGGTVSLLAAAKTGRFRCTVKFAGAAMNWERTPKLCRAMLDATARLTAPIYFLQAENDYSVAPTIELAATMAGGTVEVRSKVFPAFGLSHDEVHIFERAGPLIWGPEIRRFLQRWL
ncbi:MAG: dienelactone hydrolase family protein [Alphaproteobacteria bacterium]